MIYKWKKRFSGSAQVVGEELEELRKKSGGSLLAGTVVSAAKPENSTLHTYFDWDDTTAAKSHREAQARGLLNGICVVIMSRETEIKTRAFVVVGKEESRAYTSISVAMEDPLSRKQIIQNAFREFETFREKYHEYKELELVFDAFDEVKKTE